MLGCALLLVSFAMVMGRLVFRNLLCGGCMVEKYSKMVSHAVIPPCPYTLVSHPTRES